MIYETKLQRHITALMRKAYNAGYGHGYRNGAFDEGNGEPFDDEGGESFDIWMDEAEGVPDTAAAPLPPPAKEKS